jgi:hypothetical protein
MDSFPDLQPIPIANPEDYLDGDSLRSESKFLDGVSQLIEILKSQASPVIEVVTYSFLSQPDTIIYYPENLSDRLMTRELQAIKVSVANEVGVAPSTTIEFEDTDGVMYLSRDSVNPDLDSSDTVISLKGNVTSIKRTPDHEVNAFLYSLVGMYDKARRIIDSSDDSVVDANEIRDLIEKNAISKNINREFSLESGRTARISAIHSGKYEVLQSFSITYDTVSGKKMMAEVNTEKGLSVTFTRYDDGVGTPIYPDGGDYIQLIEILNQETVRLVADVQVDVVSPAEQRFIVDIAPTLTNTTQQDEKL